MRICAIAAVLPMMLATPAYAGDKYVVQVVQGDQETVRFFKGQATVSQEHSDGMVQLVPLAFDHGSISFGLAVFNNGNQPTNIDVSNIRVSINGVETSIYTRETLEKKAKNRAAWSAFGVALVGGLAAAAASSQRDTYRATTYTPRGMYSTYVSGPSAGGQAQAAVIAAGTGYTLAQMQNRLDETLANLGDEIVQITTVDPGASYAGRFVVAKVPFKTFPTPVAITVNWNSQEYPFTFRIVKRGTPAPMYAAPKAIPVDAPGPAAVQVAPTAVEATAAPVTATTVTVAVEAPKNVAAGNEAAPPQ